jgi:hypothetical protein
MVNNGRIDPHFCQAQIVSQARILIFQLQDFILKFCTVFRAGLVAGLGELLSSMLHLDDLKDWSRRFIILMLSYLNLWS